VEEIVSQSEAFVSVKTMPLQALQVRVFKPAGASDAHAGETSGQDSRLPLYRLQLPLH